MKTKTIFNLNSFRKQAFYDDSRGYWNKQERACQNCYKKKSDEGLMPQEAWFACLKEYQTSSSKGDWALSYSSSDDKLDKTYFDAKTPAVKKMKK